MKAFEDIEEEQAALRAYEQIAVEERSSANDDEEPLNPDKPTFRATPFGWPDPVKIPRRRWLLGHWLLRGEITAIVAPSGIGKSTFTTAIAISSASGHEFLDTTLPEGARGVWLWNLEDDQDELTRQVTASGLQHAIGPNETADRLHVDSGLDQALCTAIETTDGVKIIEPVYAALKEEIENRKIDVLIVDPFISSHSVTENDNRAIDIVTKRWKKLAVDTKCAVVLVHHTKKMGGREVRAEDSRGAVSLIATARIVLTLNAMSVEEGKRFGITEKAELRSFVRIDNDKANRSPAGNAYWFKKESVDLGNSTEDGPSDYVAAAVHWMPPDPFDGLSARDLYDVQIAINQGEHGANVQAKDWAGHAVAETLGLDLDDDCDKDRVKALLKTWTGSGAFEVESRDTSKGRSKPFLIVKDWVDPASLPTPTGGVGKGG